MNDITWLTPIIIAFSMAVINTLLGYFKNTPPEDFDLVKFLGTLLIGLTIGFLTVAFGWTYESAEEWLASSNLTIWLYWIAKIIVAKSGLSKQLPET